MPRLLDLFCGAGGAAAGYARAGFDVVGVDNRPQLNYPYESERMDALEYLEEEVIFGHAHFDAIHASPPCQAYANVTAWRGQPDSHPDLLEPTIRLLQITGLPWIVENVPEARKHWDVVLCGSQFGLEVKRHRGFLFGGWSSFTLMPPCHHLRLLPFMHKGERAYADAMGCHWMTNREARQAIPPAFTEYLGGQLMQHLAEVAA